MKSGIGQLRMHEIFIEQFVRKYEENEQIKGIWFREGVDHRRAAS